MAGEQSAEIEKLLYDDARKQIDRDDRPSVEQYAGLSDGPASGRKVECAGRRRLR